MRKAHFLILPTLLGVFLFSSQLPATTRSIRVIAKSGESLPLYKDYYAVVVGVSNYERWPKLPNAVNDAVEVASRLRELGFEVNIVLDPTSREIKTILSNMVYKIGLEENRAVLFYYAGHGETETLADGSKMGYLIPRDCPVFERDPMGFATHAISMREIESISLRIRSKHVLMLFDSCFSGSLFALVRAVPDDITEKSTLPVRQYITAGREDEEVLDRSMFKRCFLIGLEGDADLTGDGYITGSELGMYLSNTVVNYTHRQQHPQYGKINNPNLDRGDFVFVRSQRTEVGSWEKDEELRKAIDEKKALEAELRRLREKMGEGSVEGKVLQGREIEEQHLTHIKKEIMSATIETVELRATPKDLWNNDINMMVLSHNFFHRELNPKGAFANDFVNNRNDTISDRVTGLMWEKAGSSSALGWREARRYVTQLNAREFKGYMDWRIPTLPELWSLVEGNATGKSDYIHPLFNKKQLACWTNDFSSDIPNFGGETQIRLNYIVDFGEGKINLAVSISDNQPYSGLFEERHFVRAVRNME